jgi:hypothetical protein
VILIDLLARIWLVCGDFLVKRLLFQVKYAGFRQYLQGPARPISQNVVQNARFSTDGGGVNRNYKSAFCSEMTRGLFTLRPRILLRRRNNLQGFENK